jgi:hypothetical protein
MQNKIALLNASFRDDGHKEEKLIYVGFWILDSFFFVCSNLAKFLFEFESNNRGENLSRIKFFIKSS